MLALGLGAAPLARDRQDAVRMALEVAGAPPGYRDDMTVCLGLRDVGDRAVAVAVERLALRLLAHVRERGPTIDAQPGIAEAIAGGAFERHVAAAFAAAGLRPS